MLAVSTLLALTGCTGGALQPAAPGGSAGRFAAAGALSQAGIAPPARATAAPFSLYAASWYLYPNSSGENWFDTVVVYDAGHGPRTDTVYEPVPYPYSSGQPGPIAVSNAYLFGTNMAGVIYAFPLGSNSAAYSIGGAFPQYLVVDASGNLYVSAGGASVYVYAPGATTPSTMITDGLTNAGLMLVDRLGNLYVSNGSNVVVYATGTTTPLETISSGIDQVAGLAVGPKEKLYVSNAGNDTITGYTFHQTTPSETITAGLTGVGSIAIGPTGTLYAIAGSGTVTEYDNGGTAVSRTVTPPSCCIANIAVDALDDLYVVGPAKRKRGSIFVFPTGKTKALHKLVTSRTYEITIGPAW
jgi:sugar lactone lactonase YvrE